MTEDQVALNAAVREIAEEMGLFRDDQNAHVVLPHSQMFLSS